MTYRKFPIFGTRITHADVIVNESKDSAVVDGKRYIKCEMEAGSYAFVDPEWTVSMLHMAYDKRVAADKAEADSILGAERDSILKMILDISYEDFIKKFAGPSKLTSVDRPSPFGGLAITPGLIPAFDASGTLCKNLRINTDDPRHEVVEVGATRFLLHRDHIGNIAYFEVHTPPTVMASVMRAAFPLSYQFDEVIKAAEASGGKVDVGSMPQVSDWTKELTHGNIPIFAADERFIAQCTPAKLGEVDAFRLVVENGYATVLKVIQGDDGPSYVCYRREDSVAYFQQGSRNGFIDATLDRLIEFNVVKKPMNKITQGDVSKFREAVCYMDSVDANGNAFDHYQNIATKSAIYPGQGTSQGLVYVALKLNGEAGELAEHVGKAMRDDGFGPDVPLTPERRALIIKEGGDILWYLAAKCKELGIPLSEMASVNLTKLADRTERDTLRGEGDDR